MSGSKLSVRHAATEIVRLPRLSAARPGRGLQGTSSAAVLLHGCPPTCCPRQNDRFDVWVFVRLVQCLTQRL